METGKTREAFKNLSEHRREGWLAKEGNAGGASDKAQ